MANGLKAPSNLQLALGRPPFPLCPEELDAGWLDAAIGPCVAPGRRITGLRWERLGASRGMAGVVARLTLETDPTGRVPPLVAKFAATRSASLASARRARTHEREIRFYLELAPYSAVTVPQCYGAWYDPQTAAYLLFLDCIEGDSSIDELLGLNAERASLVMAELAALHASWWHSPHLARLGWLPRLDAETRRQNLAVLAGTGWPRLAALMGEDLGDRERAAGAALPDRIDEALVHLATLPSTLLHSDLRLDNLLFDPSGSRVTLVDWQGAGYGPASWDLAYFLTTSLTTTTRRRYANALLTEYQSALRRRGIDLRLDDILAGYGEALWFPLVVAASITVISDPGEPRAAALARAMGRRAFDALADAGFLA